MPHMHIALLFIVCAGLVQGTKYSDKAFFLVNVGSGRALTISGTDMNSAVLPLVGDAAPKSGQPINDKQLFVFDASAKTIKSLLWNKCCDVSGGNYNPGTGVIAYGCHGQANQQWDLVPVQGSPVPGRTETLYYVKIASQNVCLWEDKQDPQDPSVQYRKIKIAAVPTGAPTDLSLVWRKLDLLQFMRECAPDAFYIAARDNPSLVLAISNQNMADATEIVVADKVGPGDGGHLFQLWNYNPEKKTIHALRAPDMCLDLHGGNKETVILYPAHYGPNQQWSFDVSAMASGSAVSISNGMATPDPNQQYFLKNMGKGVAAKCYIVNKNGQLPAENMWVFAKGVPAPTVTSVPTVSQIVRSPAPTQPPTQLSLQPPTQLSLQPQIKLPVQIPMQGPFDNGGVKVFGFECECQ